MYLSKQQKNQFSETFGKTSLGEWARFFHNHVCLTSFSLCSNLFPSPQGWLEFSTVGVLFYVFTQDFLPDFVLGQKLTWGWAERLQELYCKGQKTRSKEGAFKCLKASWFLLSTVCLLPTVAQRGVSRNSSISVPVYPSRLSPVHTQNVSTQTRHSRVESSTRMSPPRPPVITARPTPRSSSLPNNASSKARRVNNRCNINRNKRLSGMPVYKPHFSGLFYMH